MTAGKKWHPSHGWLSKHQIDELIALKDGPTYHDKRRKYDAAAFKKRMAANSKSQRVKKGISHDDGSVQRPIQTSFLPTMPPRHR